jgi:hypothetical protein
MRTGVEQTTNLSDIAQYKQTLQITDRAYTQPKNTLDDVCINVSFNLRLRACAAHHMSESTCFCDGREVQRRTKTCQSMHKRKYISECQCPKRS